MRYEDGRTRKSGNACCATVLAGLVFAATAAPFAVSPAKAEPPATTVGYQPMVSTGLAAKHAFEAWFIFDKSPDPTKSGYTVAAGTTVRFTFPKEFTPLPGSPHLEAALLYGWPHGAIHVPFSITQDGRTVTVRIEKAISVDTPERPGLKAIHIRTGELNPPNPGDYPVTVAFVDAGPLTGTTKAVAHIDANPVPNIAAFNQLHQSKDEDWQRVKPGAEAPLPIDFLVNLPNESRSSLSLAPAGDGTLSILSDGKRIGSITTSGVPVTLTPHPFGPGFSRLGIVEVRAKAGPTPGQAQIVAALDGGTRYVITLLVEQP